MDCCDLIVKYIGQNHILTEGIFSQCCLPSYECLILSKRNLLNWKLTTHLECLGIRFVLPYNLCYVKYRTDKRETSSITALMIILMYCFLQFSCSASINDISSVSKYCYPYVNHILDFISWFQTPVQCVMKSCPSVFFHHAFFLMAFYTHFHFLFAIFVWPISFLPGPIMLPCLEFSFFSFLLHYHSFLSRILFWILWWIVSLGNFVPH